MTLEEISATQYYCGGFNGGIAQEFIKMCEVLDCAIDKDLENGIVARWYDETHLNKYVCSLSPLVYAKILLFDKRKPRYGGQDYFRALDNKKYTYFAYFKDEVKRKIKNFSKKLKNKFFISKNT